jgi:hypothetical protein
MKPLLSALALVASCAHIRPCGTTIAIVEYGYCADPRFAVCEINFAAPVPPRGCWMPIDPQGPSEREVICVRSCTEAP